MIINKNSIPVHMYTSFQLLKHSGVTRPMLGKGVPKVDGGAQAHPTRLCHWTESCSLNAAVNGKLELTLLKGRQRFDTVSTSNLKV